MVRIVIGKLLANEEIERGKRISTREIASETGLARGTIGGIRMGRTSRIDLHVIDSFLEYFRARGKEYDVGDFFEYKPEVAQ